MLRTVVTVSSLLLATGVLLLGNGLLGTLISLRAGVEHYSGMLTGVIMSGYYVGFALGTYIAPPLVRRVRQIRVFTSFAGMLAAAVILHGLFVHPITWFGLRVVTGACMVGLYLVLESWLNASVSRERRGSIFAVYMLIILLSLAGGQYLIVPYGPVEMASYALVALFTCLALVPVALTRMVEPPIAEAPRLNLSMLVTLAPLATAGAFAAGMASSAFWSLGPFYAQQVGLAELEVALFMSTIIVGGALLQIPIGHYSDRHDRVRVLMLTCLTGALTGLAAIMTGALSQAAFYGYLFVFGGFLFTVYSICVAQANDQVHPDEMLECARGMLLLNGMGAMIGPTLAGVLMERLGANALFGYVSAVLLVLAAYAAYVRRAMPTPAVQEQQEFVAAVRTSPAAFELHPGIETPEADVGDVEAGGEAGTRHLPDVAADEDGPPAPRHPP